MVINLGDERAICLSTQNKGSNDILNKYLPEEMWKFKMKNVNENSGIASLTVKERHTQLF